MEILLYMVMAMFTSHTDLNSATQVQQEITQNQTLATERRITFKAKEGATVADGD